jgi:sulfur transfer protein SufE
MRLPGCQHQVERIAQGIDEHVNFGAQSSARFADGLRAVFFRAPALC